MLDDLSTQLKPEMLGILIFIKKRWSLTLHEVQRKHAYTCKGQKVEVEQTEMDVNVKEIRDLYVSISLWKEQDC